MRKSIMKNRLATLIALAGMAIGASSAYAIINYTPGAGVLDSPHNMLLVVPNSDGTNNRVCAFCHTPHHAKNTSEMGGSDYGPLWSHNLSTMSYTVYDSPTFNGEAVMAADPLLGPSRLCMSCHDGSIAIDQHYGMAGTTIRADGDSWDGIDVAGGGDLTNDHPIGFNYVAVQGGESVTPGVNADKEQGIYYGIYPVDKVFAVTVLNATQYATSGTGGVVDTPSYHMQVAGAAHGGTDFVNRIRKIGDLMYTPENGTATDMYMTCASCHDVHNKEVAANSRYLIVNSNTNSALCLTCHNK